jgi:hypothetical protein
MSKTDLSNKKILYLGPVYFSYDQAIIEKLRHLGCIVETFELYLKGFRYKFINKFKPGELERFKENYYKGALKNNNYDYILVRHGYQLSAAFYKKLRALNPNALFVNFHWDSLKDSYNYIPIIHCFDKIYSFDYNDCRNNKKLQYLPLFFTDEYLDHQTQTQSTFKYDLVFIGAWRNKERYHLIQNTKNWCEQHQLRFYYYLYLSLVRQFWAVKNGEIPKKAKSKHLSHQQILKLFEVSNVIIDFPSSFQSGLTIRTFEALGAGKKLITTNKNIIQEPFYNPEYISVFDPEKRNLDVDFIKSIPTISIKDKMKNYSIESYLYKLLEY